MKLRLQLMMDESETKKISFSDMKHAFHVKKKKRKQNIIDKRLQNQS